MDIFAQNGVIISAERAEFTAEENARRNADLVCALVNIVGWDGRIIPCTGSFEGVEEQSYIVVINEDIVEDLVLARAMMQELLLIAHKFNQDAILVFQPDGVRLLELPAIKILGDVTDQDTKEAIMYVYDLTGNELLSDLMYFDEVDQYSVEELDLDYTEVFGRYYTLES